MFVSYFCLVSDIFFKMHTVTRPITSHTSAEIKVVS